MKRLKLRLYEIIFEADTKAGKWFDIILIGLILFSIVIVMIESDNRVMPNAQLWVDIVEWTVTILFTIEYFLRIWIIDKPRKYIFSFFGIIDLLSILPSFIGLFFAGTQMLLVLRSLRLLRVFRVLKLTRYVKEATALWEALAAGRNKIGVFLFAVLILITILGTVMYLIEKPYNEGFRSIPESIYWAVVTLTTVGYGDIAPVTTLGKFVAGVIMIIGYAIIAVPTGIVTSELAKEFTRKTPTNTQVCSHCFKDNHDDDAIHCKYCGGKLNNE
nr:ion transporter [uncultured Carboxylicivirga sp.]